MIRPSSIDAERLGYLAIVSAAEQFLGVQQFGDADTQIILLMRLRAVMRCCDCMACRLEWLLEGLDWIDRRHAEDAGPTAKPGAIELPPHSCGRAKG